MRKALHSLLLVLVGILSGCAPSNAEPHIGRNFVIFCVPSLSEADRNEVFCDFQKFVSGGGGPKADPAKGMVPGDSIQIFNASDLKEIGAHFVIPEEARTPALQYRAAAAIVGNFGKFLKESTADDHPVDLPKIVSSFREKVISQNADVLLIGSPLYHDDVVAHDMREGWLSDGYFTQEPSVTVFSTAARHGALRESGIRFCTLSDDIWKTENKGSHQEMVRRFWALYIGQCGGKLLSFQSDIPTGFHALVVGDLPDLAETNGYKINPEDTQMEVRRSRTILKPATTKVDEGNVATQATVASESKIDLSSAEFSWLTGDASAYRRLHPGPKNLPEKGKVLIGLVWDTKKNPMDTDLDLRVREPGSNQELAFDSTQTPLGRHFKDFSNAKANHGFELVDIDVPANPKDLEIWVNAYGGHSKSGFSGEVRVLYSGKLSTYPVAIKSIEGSCGKATPSREKDVAWARIKYNEQ